MLIGTRYKGIAHFTNDKFTPLTKKEGLASNAVWCMASDTTGTVVVGTENGGQILSTTGGFNFNKSIYESGEHISSCGLGKNGLAWFVSASGLTIVDGAQSKQQSGSPPIYLQSVRVNDVSVDIASTGEFAHDQNHIDIHFTGIHFKEPEAVKYEYRLLPSEQVWSQPISNFSVTYAQLIPGNYTFEVRAIAGDGVRSERPASYSFTIASPIWKRWWFIFSANVVVIGLLWLAYRYRTNQLLKIERLRTRISADLHDEIASNLSSIVMFSKIIEDESRATTTIQTHHQSLLNRIATLSQESVQSIRDIIWAIDPKTETLESLLNRLRDFTFALCRAKNIQVDFPFLKEEEFSTDDLTPEVRKNVWLIAKEAIHNSVQHSQCNAIRISYKLNGTMLTIRIEDDGVGFSEKKSSKGKGLATMRLRAKQLDGKIEIGRNEKGGTSVIACVKIVGGDSSRLWSK
jgi:signal transduction histidine kinase